MFVQSTNQKLKKKNNKNNDTTARRIGNIAIDMRLILYRSGHQNLYFHADMDSLRQRLCNLFFDAIIEREKQ